MADIIQLLPDSVANQIAAGEVVQRPASAVKEMMENAIDSGASKIELIIKDSGKTLIQVIDNGCGMSETDARLSFERHATSKIRSANDLFAIKSFGFRGEALASIAAIAQVEMKSRLHDSDLGTRVVIEGSKVIEQELCQCAAGTSIGVKNLFYNVPARRNFLKSDAVEFGHIEEEFRRITLAHPQIEFVFHHNGKLVYKLEKANLLQRIVSVFGDGYKQRFLPVEQTSNIVNVSGYVSKAEFAKKTRGEQYFFANNRFIKYPYLHHAVENAFNELLPEKYFPSYFLFLEIDPQSIDVNIHPTKTEVKFLEEKSMYAILRSAVKKSLGQFTLSSQIDFDMDGSLNFPPPPKDYVPKAPTVDVNPFFNPFEKKETFSAGNSSKNYTKPTVSFREESNAKNWDKFFQQPLETELVPQEKVNLPFEEEKKEEKSHTAVPSAPIFQFKNQYIVTSLKSGIVFIDQEKAHERILFERFSQSKNQEQTICQQLVFPVTCSFSASNAEILKEILPEIKSHGFDIEEFGANTFLVRGLPEKISEQEVELSLENLIDTYKNSLLQKHCQKESGIALSMAKQFSVKAGKELKPEEMQSLVADLFTCQAPTVSPSGKKTFYILKESDLIEKLKS